MLSKRASKSDEQPNLLHTAWYKQHVNSYDADTNPNGIINLGTAENRVIEDVIMQKLSTINMGNIPEAYTHYCKLSGTDGFRDKLCTFLEENLKPSQNLNRDDIYVMNGCGTVIESIGYALCDPGDGVLIPAPYYCGFKSDLEQRVGVKVCPVHLSSKGGNKEFQLTVEDLEDAFLLAEESGTPIKALLLSNPNNPLGNMYTKDELKSYLAFCRSYNIHLICDEIYMLSVYDEQAQFTSILSLENISEYNDIVHVVWGFSKDFALSGFRCGVAVTKNKELQGALTSIGYYSSIPTATQYILEEMITDKEWLDTMKQTNHRRLREARKMVCDKLSKAGIPYVYPNSGLFIWMKLADFLETKTKSSEVNMFNTLMNNGVYLVPGFAFECNEHGWFRMIIARDIDVLNIALDRIEKTVAINVPKVGSKRAAKDDLLLLEHFRKGHLCSRNLRRMSANRV